MITIDDVPIKPWITIFPDKTSQVWKIPEELFLQARVLIEWRFEEEAEFMHLAQLKDLLDTRGIKASLHMPYLPYARQDKDFSNTATFGLNTFAKLLNELKFDSVSCVDAHSGTAQEIIKNFYSIVPYIYIKEACGLVSPDVICFPDQGAHCKYFSLPFDHSKIWGKKKRDQETGNIEGYSLEGSGFVALRGCRVLVVDDICDGGATFTHLAKALHDEGASELHLYVSHGLFTKGTKLLREAGYQRIFTKNGELK